MHTILFMDDDPGRHETFDMLCSFTNKIKILHAYTAEQALEFVKREKILAAYLDHDLCIEDILCDPGKPSKEKTGSWFTGQLLSLYRESQEKPFQFAIIHTWNSEGAKKMGADLNDLGIPNRPEQFRANRQNMLREFLVHREFMDDLKESIGG